MKKVLLLGLCWGLAIAAQAADYYVTSPADSGIGSLRQAVALADINPGLDTVWLDPAVGMIMLNNMIEVNDATVIEGRGATINAASSVSNHLNLRIDSSGSVINNLALINGNVGIYIWSSDNVVKNCVIGTDWADTVGVGMGTGILVSGVMSVNNRIGLPGEGNVISGCSSNGIRMANSYSSKIQGNRIGTNRAGTAAIANSIGIALISSTYGNLIGGIGANEGNLISGNSAYGVYLNMDTCQGNTLAGNAIGTNAAQTANIQNYNGIYIYGAQNNYIGLPVANGGNIICGNSYAGICGGRSAIVPGVGNIIQNNLIGITPAGATIGNNTGIMLNELDGTLIGGDRGVNPLVTNIISGNLTHGVSVRGYGNTVCGNYIGTDQTGTSVRPNGNYQMLIGNTTGNAVGNLIGGQAAGQKNIICGYNYSIGVSGSGTHENKFQGSWINVFADHTQPISTSRSNAGMLLSNGAYGNFVGDAGSGVGNLINGTLVYGIFSQASAQQNCFVNNTICAYTGAGILMEAGANGNQDAPIILFAHTSVVWGRAAAYDLVQVFTSDGAPGSHGGSLQYVGQTTANANGDWSLLLSGVPAGTVLTAIATDADNNSSEFAANSMVMVATPTTTPSFTPTGTASITATSTITPTITPTASPSATNSATTTITATPSATPTISLTVTMTPTLTLTPVLTATATRTTVLVKTSKDILAYPNPAKTEVNFAFGQSQWENVVISVYNSVGERVAEINAEQPGAVIKWDVRFLAAGIYLYQAVLTDSGTEQKTALQKLAIIK